MDEIDSLLTSRTESDIESSRRIKTEFLVQMEGIAQDAAERLLFIGATNRCNFLSTFFFFNLEMKLIYHLDLKNLITQH